MIKAGEEEKALAIANNENRDGIPAITVLCDGGWSERAHKHIFNDMAGVGVIFGLLAKSYYTLALEVVCVTYVARLKQRILSLKHEYC